MRVELPYGESLLGVDLPDSSVVIEPSHHRGLTDPLAALRDALARPVKGPPLRARVHKGQTVAISICDGTRPQPRALLLEAILEQLEGIVELSDVVVLVATGTHRANTQAEIESMLGASLTNTVRVVNHDCRNPANLKYVGVLGDKVPVWLNSEWLAADVRITTGLVEPHFFAGFSGGPKMVAPGLAGLETVLVLHDAKRIGHPYSKWGVVDGNPIQSDIQAIALATGVDFALDVIVNREQEVVAAFGGDLLAMHQEATKLCRKISMVPVEAPFDVVVTTNSGFPLDQNLYQAGKGMAAAAEVVVEGGQIVCAAECRHGFPGSYGELLATSRSPAETLREIEARSQTVPDQWAVQVHAKILCHARVALYCNGISDEDLEKVGLEPTGDVGDCAREALRRAGDSARVCVLPDGPQTIPYIAV